MKKYFLIGLVSFCLVFGLTTNFCFGEQNEINLYFFWGQGCPHCAQEKIFLESLETKYSSLKIYDYDISNNDRTNIEILIEISKKLDIDVSGVPITIINDKAIIGYYNYETTGKQIEEQIIQCLNTPCLDSVKTIVLNQNQQIITSQKETPSTTTTTTILNKEELPLEQLIEHSSLPSTLKIPLIGEIETKNLSLPALSIILGGLDGFNPCAMWVLIFLITFLIKMKNRKRMWFLGITFILSSAIVYFLFMTAWLNLILFLGFIFWVRLIVGLVAIGSGIYNFKEYFINPDASCKVTNTEHKKSILEKIKTIVHKKSLFLAFIGIIILAAMVNLIELICSAGFPVVFTQTLALSNLTNWQYYFYMLLYIFAFLLDDLIVFVGAMLTLRVTGLTNKYTRFSHLIGGILMFLIGILLIFKPELLMFG